MVAQYENGHAFGGHAMHVTNPGTVTSLDLHPFVVLLTLAGLHRML